MCNRYSLSVYDNFDRTVFRKYYKTFDSLIRDIDCFRDVYYSDDYLMVFVDLDTNDSISRRSIESALYFFDSEKYCKDRYVIRKDF